MAPDSFKGALRADKAAAALAEGWKSVRKDDEVLQIPLSDGGEGLMAALKKSLNGEFLEIASHDALMREITAKVVVAGKKLAVIESAEANGIELLSKNELNPLAATTYGVGEMIRFLLDAGYENFIIGIGGSATVDGGAGMLQALGAEFFDESGNLFPPGIGGGALHDVKKIDFSRLHDQIKNSSIKVACDVTNPLCGENGAAKIFGPQKGATPEMVDALDKNLFHYAEICKFSGNSPGDGAAGGLGFALRNILQAEIVSGAELVMEYSGFNAALSGCSLVITGEGCSDNQTAFGKLCACAAEKAHANGVPILLFSGALRGETDDLDALFDGCFSIARGPCSLAEAIADTEKNLYRAGANAAKLAGKF